jgi:hypothetical protein
VLPRICGVQAVLGLDTQGRCNLVQQKKEGERRGAGWVDLNNPHALELQLTGVPSKKRMHF